MVPALYIGRFQPFHNGHLDALKQIFAREEKVIIAIGSSNVSDTPENPYTALKRNAFIRGALAEFIEYSGRYTIIEIPDINNNERWPAHVEELVKKSVGDFGAVYTGSPLTKALFSQYSSHSVIDLKKNLEVSATEVRFKILNKEDWKAFVPKNVAIEVEKNLAPRDL